MSNSDHDASPPRASTQRKKPDDQVYITRLSADRKTRAYVRAGHQHSQRKLTTNRSEAEVFTRERAEFLLARGRPDPRYKPRIEEAETDEQRR